MKTKDAPIDSKTKILNTALTVFREKGYADTSIDDICRGSGMAKGGFFHHFKSKEELAVAAADHFTAMAEDAFANADYRLDPDPRGRVLGYVDFRIALLKGDLPQITCLLGTLVQETYETHPAIREVCNRHLFGRASDIAVDIAEAKRLYCPDATWSPEDVGNFVESVTQGAFVLAKAKANADVAVACLTHLKVHLQTLLAPANAPCEEVTISTQ